MGERDYVKAAREYVDGLDAHLSEGQDRTTKVGYIEQLLIYVRLLADEVERLRAPSPAREPSEEARKAAEEIRQEPG